MSLSSEFRKFAGFRVLEFFLKNPLLEIHLKELSREAGISAGSAKSHCDSLEKAGLLVSERKGNLRVLRLASEDFAARELKKAYFAVLLKEAGIERVCPGCSSLAVYGSLASGEFDEKSDLDLLAIGDKKQVDFSLLRKIEEKAGRKIQLTVMPFYRWKKARKERASFAENVLRKHLLVKGIPL